MKVLLAQINPTIGALKDNTNKIIERIQQGRALGARIVLFPELALCGYPPEDFVLLPHFIQEIEKELERIIQASRNIAVIVGLPRQNPKTGEKTLYNSAAIIDNQKLIGYQDKVLLPTYDVFDERRYFEPGGKVPVWTIDGKKIGITICEDLWQHSRLLQSADYSRDPILELKDQHPDILLNLSASPYSLSKFQVRQQVCLKAASTLQCPVLLCNQVGGNDSLIFDGYSLYVGPEGLLQCAKGFEEDGMLVDLDQHLSILHLERNAIEDLFQALVLGLRDYFGKLGFKKACLGLSGGIDSAVVASLAAEALGPSNVLAVYMPSRFSSTESGRDAAKLAQNLAIAYKEISIENPFESYLSVLGPHFEKREKNTTEENLQARIRGMILMALSNKFGYIVLSTGNKSELAVGYSTLYGDMCGGLGVLSDVTKQEVYALAHWINRKEEIIPSNTINRAPSAELRPNQKDTDSLPDYAILDNVLCAYVEDHMAPEQIAEKYKYSLELVEDLVRRIHFNEYKRRQAPPGLRISEKAFSVGRRFPIVQGWT